MEKVLVVGGGAREDSIVKTLADSGAAVYSISPLKNPGIARRVADYSSRHETDSEGITKQAAAWQCDLVVLGNDAAIAAGVSGALERQGILCASPTKEAGEIEWNKAFMRELLDRHHIDGNVDWRVFDATNGLREYIDASGAVVVKPLGLTGGKGVKVMGEHLKTTEDAYDYANEIVAKGEPVLIEELLDGEEFSLQAFTDGKTVVPMPLVQDHKRAFEGDTGHNTGSMGSYSDSGGTLPFVTQQEYEKSLGILRSIVRALAAEDRTYRGTIYGQFMLTHNGPKLIEINARFGDPEAMNVLSLLDSDYVEILHAINEGTLNNSRVRFRPDATVCTYVVPNGYGTKQVASGRPLSVDEVAIRAAGADLFYGVVEQTLHGLQTTTSRSVAIVGKGETIAGAYNVVSRALPCVKGEVYRRKDIGTEELIAARVAHMARIR